jgi:S1-C subfamily serine protease
LVFVLAVVLGWVGGRALESSTSPTALNPTSGASIVQPSSTAPSTSNGSNGSSDSNGSSGSAGSSQGGTSDASTIAATVEPAVVDITTTLDNGEAAGTGMVISKSGLVLTNNHVINGETSISVQISGTASKYSAHVVGYDKSADVAVIQLENASNLATIPVGDSTNVATGDSVVAIGNALGAPGPESVTDGAVTALNQTITATDETGADAETLQGLIETDAPLQPGDSGGALVNSSGQVIGMNSAAETSQRRVTSGSTAGYAIPINDALTLAKQIVSGQASSDIHIGDRAILGVEAATSQTTSRGVLVAGVASSSPADTAGIQAGDVITAINGTSVNSVDELQAALGNDHPGDKVSVSWTSGGATHSAKVALTAGAPN